MKFNLNITMQHQFPFVRTKNESNHFFNNHLHFSKIEKIIIGIAISSILLISAFGFILNAGELAPQNNTHVTSSPTTTPTPTNSKTPAPTLTSTLTPTVKAPEIRNIGGTAPIIPPETQKAPGLIETYQNMNSTAWRAVAANAWAYFQPSRAIDSTTGLPAAVLGWNYFTDWDLSVYMQAVMEAEKIGLITKDGEWGARARLQKVMLFLETRELNSTTKVPYWFYQSDGKGFLNQTNIDLIDTGTLLVALSKVKSYEPTLAPRIDRFVYNTNNNGTDYASLVPVVKNMLGSASIYSYYCASGFALFWPNELSTVPNKILDNMYSSTVTSYNVTLPKGDISCEPLLNAWFNLDYDYRIDSMLNATYAAHEARYNATDQYAAFSEGNAPTGFVWEYVVTAKGDKWIVSDGQKILDINPVMFTKVALSFLSIFNTTYAKNVCLYLEKVCPEPTNGYIDGADYNKDTSLVSVVGSSSCLTNSLILSAARHAISTKTK